MDARMAVSPLGAGPASPDCKPGRRQKARLAREREIVRAASGVFAALGYDLVNMQVIADAAGVTKATLYAYFENKAQLFRAVIEHWMEELPEPALAYSAEGDLRAQLNEVAQALLRQAGHPASLALASLLARSNWIAQKRWRQRHRPYRSYLEQALSRCPHCSDPARAASQFLLLAVGSLESGTVLPVDEARVIAAVDLFVRAYADDESADRRAIHIQR